MELSTDISRRSFLAGAAVLGAALALGPNGLPRPGALARLARSDAPRLSIGYVEDSAGLSPSDARAMLEAGRTRVVPASSLRVTPRSLSNGTVKVRIGRLTPGAHTRVGGQADALVAPPPGAGAEPLPFYAWTMQPGGASGSSEFAAAVVPEPTLGFSVRRAEREAVAVFTAGRDRDLPKLHEGLYLLGFDESVWATRRDLLGASDPAWPSLASLAVSVHAA